jgi:SAM-dependent methyltransferase
VSRQPDKSIDLQGHRRLYPSLTDPSWLILRTRREIFRRWIERDDPRDLTVLDIGGRIQPYRELLEGRIRAYIAIDILETSLVDIVARGEQIPLKSVQFDLVICTQTLQYASDPAFVIGEIYRVLRPGGVLLLSAPATAIRDADEEAWRFFPVTLGKLLGQFRKIEILPEGGSVIGLFRTINMGLGITVRYPFLRSIYRWTVCPIVNLLGYTIDKCARSDNEQFTANYSAWAMK